MSKFGLRRKEVTLLVRKIDALLDRLVPPVAAPPDFAEHLAFRWEQAEACLKPVHHPHLFDLRNLVGIDDVRDEVVRNTRQFVAGFPANNVLLWGERGCGKSSLVKGMLTLFGGSGLRLIEVSRRDLLSLPKISEQLRGAAYRFILFCDDLSFEAGDGDFRALKTILDGDIEERPANVLLYATSNRRHLLPERMDDNLGGGEIHPEEAVSDKLALADRFGISLGVYALNQDEYLAVVRHYAAVRKLEVPDNVLTRNALLWLRSFASNSSGRTALHFINDLEGQRGVAAVS